MISQLEGLGAVVIAGLRGVGNVALLFADVVTWIGRCVRDWELPADWRTIVWQLYFIGVQSLPVVLTTGAFTGMVLSYNSYFELQRLGVTSWVGPLVAESLVEQLGPVLAGLMLAGRVGGAMAAELGTMAVTEQVDALRTMGVNPVRYLVVPRVVACTLLTPILSTFATAVGILAGFALAIYGLGSDPHFMWKETVKFVAPFDFFMGMTKAAVFGCGIALICCHKGLNTRGGAEGVGKATTDANVESCIFILIANLILTMVLMMIDPTA